MLISTEIFNTTQCRHVLLVCTENYEEGASFSLCGPLTWLNSPYQTSLASVYGTCAQLISGRCIAIFRNKEVWFNQSKTDILCCTPLRVYIYIIKFHGKQRNRALVRIITLLVIWKQTGADHVGLTAVTSSRVWGPSFWPVGARCTTISCGCLMQFKLKLGWLYPCFKDKAKNLQRL